VARQDQRLPDNVPGDFFVDTTCIDCDLCRQIAPASFGRADRAQQSYVHHQPAGEAERHRALMALVTCPTASIGMTRKLDARAAARAFPEQIVDDVWFCGYAAESSYGAASWLIRRPRGNVLVDSPRAARTLFDRIDELGGVRWMFLTHRDDVADHHAWHERFGCERVLHAGDVTRDTTAVERQLTGAAPVALDGDLLAIPVPGHTRGSIALLYRDRFLFSGDHLWANDDETGLEAGEDVCWYSWPEQRRSIARLADHRFEGVLPGHGRPFHAASPEAMRAEVARLAAELG
jgi:glyoxylase-like metal-dependent hydrolase (beta-lactamase superfamily II)/ferredoxin